MAWVLHSSIHPGLASLLKHPSLLVFCSGVQNGRCPGKDLDPTVHGVEESKHHPQAPTAHLPWPAAIFGFAQAFQVGLFRSSEGVRFTAYPLQNFPPAAWMMSGNVCLLKPDTHFSLAATSTQSMRIICGKKGERALTKIYKSRLDVT